MGKRGRITLQTIAQEVGLSKFAVSRSLAGKSGVSEETRALIRATAERLGYTRPAGQSQSNDIAVVFHDLDAVNSELYMQIQNGVQREAHRLGMALRIRWTHSAGQLEELAHACAGLMLVGPHDREAVAAATATGIPIVRFGWVDPLEEADQITGTDHEAGQAVLQYLVGLGHRSIVYVSGSPGFRGRRERFYGAREIAERHEDVSLQVLEFDEQNGFGAAFRDLKKRGIPPTAFFCAHDGLALTVVSELLGQGYRIPDDVSVVGFGDFSPATQISPPLTTVKMEGQEAGAVGLSLLIERIENPRLSGMPARRVMIASRIVERRSAGPCTGCTEPSRATLGGKPSSRSIRSR
ncbi:LacI family DNA-binding transcriptional regulator [Rhizobium hidalgonense]|uniref:LacI family DNA-binding transcriptional regulator n=1 Tax=Rhizobium hidalgonense TaxID=1538159 RepID=UPI002870D533|nr:LacI family DNA-binding transcriptional regulator [Rhizobium hidalgonense]MDR9805645.1 LacI family DNA-binding transcriptional regulator [Rhizobium hidalgonense]